MRRAELESVCATEYQRLVGTLTLYCGSHAVAQELAQEALIRVCQHWNRVRRLQNPGAWANRVAMNLANSHIR
jgi:DNA-directed RNA polymerase specialized sigma24 family protein